MNFKPLPPLTRLLVVLLKVNVALLTIAVITDIYAWFEYSNLDPDLDVSEIFLHSDLVGLPVAIVRILLAIFLGVTFLQWIYRANKNLHFLSSEPMTFSPGWSVGWYFIPIANAFKPYQAMKEIWAVAHRGASCSGTIIGWWWFLWLLSLFLGRLSTKLGFRAEFAQDFVRSAIVDITANGTAIVLNIVAISLVTMIDRAYGENYIEVKQTTTPSDGYTLPLGRSEDLEGR